MAREKAESTIPTLGISLALITSTLIYFIPHPIDTQIHENYSESYQVIEVNPQVFIYLDVGSSITIRRNKPIQIELIRGEAFFDIQTKSKTLDQLEIIIGNARISNMGTRFSITMQKKSHEIVITDGQVELQLPAKRYIIGAGRKVEFDDYHMIEDSMVTDAKASPWITQ